MILIHDLIEDIKAINSQMIPLRQAIGEAPNNLKTEIVAALIVANAIHKSTIQTVHLYSAIQDLTSTLREMMDILPPLPKVDST